MIEREPSLEAAILADPDAREAYAVYGDWLQQRGDPHGELVSVQLALEAHPHDEALLARERELLAAHAGEWLHGRTGDYPWQTTVTWRRGFVHRAELPTTYDTDDSADSYRDFMTIPAVRFVRELHLGVKCTYGGSGDRDVAILEALRDHPAPALARLVLDAFDFQLSWTHVGDLSIANASLQQLRELHVIAGDVTLGAIDLPALRALRIETGGLRAHVLDSIADARWPALESLVLYLGTDDYGGSCTTRETARILAGTNLPNVRELALCNGTFADELAAQIASAPILRQLQRLDLSKGTLGIDGARAILANAAAFAHLDRLDLAQNYLPASITGALARVCASVNVAHQNQESEYGRFVTVSE